LEQDTIGLLLLSAALHAVWNLLVKRSNDKQVFLWLALTISLLALLFPFIFFSKPFPAVGWLYIVPSALLEAFYFVLLGNAYSQGDLSLVYPLARGSAPVFVLLFASFFLGERVTWGGAVGIACVTLGIYILHIKGPNLRTLLAPFRSFAERPSLLAILTGLTIASYSVVDKAAMGHVDPLTYLYLVFLVTCILLAPVMLRKRQALAIEWHKQRVSIVAVGTMSAAGFLLVLVALTSTQVSYVTPVREISVVFGALLGGIVLREAFAFAKVLGSVVIFAGVVCISLLT
jgi:drug/metabolite transporter (DMT)-like permease